MSFRKSSPKEPEHHAELLNVVRRGIQIAAHIYAHIGDSETQAWLEEWLSDARAAIARVTRP